jgi:hypothetical protein
MPEENRVFDVSKPSKVSPSATSRPVIVGHHPMMADPMMKEKEEDHHLVGDSHQSTKINVSDDSSDNGAPARIFPSHHEHQMNDSQLDDGPKHEDFSVGHQSPSIFKTHDDEKDFEPDWPTAASAVEDEHDRRHGDHDEPFHHDDHDEKPLHHADHESPHHAGHIEGLHLAGPPKGRSKLKMFMVALVLLVIGGYLLIDSGLVSANVDLPFHIFKQKSDETPAPVAAPQKQAVSSTPAVPDGFKTYKLAGTTLTFAAPTTWGEPTSVPVNGYSKRGADAKTDGTYAYIVSFAGNKNIEVAVTSAKYLPPARAPQYYDYLQWCTGTNDGKFYQSLLHFTTENKVDTPSTISCDQGPLAAQKLTDTTLVQAKAKDATGKDLGDIYTKNLKNDNLVVFRVKDTAMTSGSDIKLLLATVQVPAAPASSSSSGQ